MQADVRIEAQIEAHFPRTQIARAHDVRTPSIGIAYFFPRKVFGILKPFFQKGFKWVWAKPTTLPCGEFRVSSGSFRHGKPCHLPPGGRLLLVQLTS